MKPSIIHIITLLHTFIPIINAQCGTDCLACSGAPSTCQSDTQNRCIYNFPAFKCEVDQCGPDCILCDDNEIACKSDSLPCFWIIDNNKCRPANDCKSYCELCENQFDCENKGSAGLCQWDNGFCIGITCNTNCVQCSGQGQQACEGSNSLPNGCKLAAPFSEECISLSVNPTTTPTSNPTVMPTTKQPTTPPSYDPSISPTNNPSQFPTNNPSPFPTEIPTNYPTDSPTVNPTPAPITFLPTFESTQTPTDYPTGFPIKQPTPAPTSEPTHAPSNYPSLSPSLNPTFSPSMTPTRTPTHSPTLVPTISPSIAPITPPSVAPTLAPLNAPNVAPTLAPIISPLIAPTLAPSAAPTPMCHHAKYKYKMIKSQIAQRNDILYGGESLVSVNCRFLLFMKTNGNLIIKGLVGRYHDPFAKDQYGRYTNEKIPMKFYDGWETGTYIKNISGEVVPKLVLENGSLAVYEETLQGVDGIAEILLWDTQTDSQSELSDNNYSENELILILTDKACLELYTYGSGIARATPIWSVCAQLRRITSTSIIETGNIDETFDNIYTRDENEKNNISTLWIVIISLIVSVVLIFLGVMVIRYYSHQSSMKTFALSSAVVSTNHIQQIQTPESGFQTYNDVDVDFNVHDVDGETEKALELWFMEHGNQ